VWSAITATPPSGLKPDGIGVAGISTTRSSRRPDSHVRVFVEPAARRIDLPDIHVPTVVKPPARIRPEIGIADAGAGREQQREKKRDDRRT